MKLITGAECVRKMRQAGVFKGKESYFSQLVAKGVIPYHDKKGSPKKWFVLDEVKQAVKDWEDPTRDAQREANEQKRKPGKKAKAEATLNYLYLTRGIMQKIKPLSLDMFELEEDSELTEAEIIKINAQNQIIQDMIIFCINGRKDEDGLTGIIETFNKVDYMQGWLMDKDRIIEMYDGVKR